ncbi:hypothetical protein BZL35_00491 [Candidatus Pandoraea novymonadis]|uniref:Uncharacterized protein n=1 Tax=Candidatus Pandoraea novymonadis TaxID=1808959 RepID=A0ABX5FEY2_9BURK|nr:hypothetical protein BZL35_00491 [Candidatus Pandoraea novymonadis]
MAIQDYPKSRKLLGKKLYWVFPDASSTSRSFYIAFYLLGMQLSNTKGSISWKNKS